MALTLVIGNKNYSSWSMRPWIALRSAGIAFSEIVIPLYESTSKERILGFTPSGKVPTLIDGDVIVWDSLSILEYAAEKYPDANLWPRDPARRAHARSVSAEMHSGFANLRNECGMNIHRQPRAKTLSAETQAEIARIQRSWSECRERHGASGPFLFGPFTAADAMYAPVVSRFLSYAIAVTPPVRAYMDAMTALPAWQEWTKGALAETWVIEKFEDA